MSRSIGINTDPLEVEIYVENGLIKGRIVTLESNIVNNVLNNIVNIVDEKQENILTKIFTNVHSFTKPVFNTFDVTNYNIKLDMQFSDRYEYFDFITYANKYNIHDIRSRVYNHYSTNNGNIVFQSDDSKPDTSDIINILMTARERMMDKFLIIFTNTPQYNVIDKYHHDDIFNDYDMIASVTQINGAILCYNAIMINSVCYDELIESMSSGKAPWYIHVANYMDNNIFKTMITEEPIFK